MEKKLTINLRATGDRYLFHREQTKGAISALILEVKVLIIFPLRQFYVTFIVVMNHSQGDLLKKHHKLWILRHELELISVN